jgi:hypothetical protein
MVYPLASPANTFPDVSMNAPEFTTTLYDSPGIKVLPVNMASNRSMNTLAVGISTLP